MLNLKVALSSFWQLVVIKTKSSRQTSLPRSTFSTSILNKSLHLKFATKSNGLRRLSLKLNKFFLIMNILWKGFFSEMILKKIMHPYLPKLFTHNLLKSQQHMIFSLSVTSVFIKVLLKKEL